MILKNTDFNFKKHRFQKVQISKSTDFKKHKFQKAQISKCIDSKIHYHTIQEISTNHRFSKSHHGAQ